MPLHYARSATAAVGASRQLRPTSHPVAMSPRIWRAGVPITPVVNERSRCGVRVGYSTCMLLGSEYSTDPHAMPIEEPVTAEVTGQLGPCQLGPCGTHWGSRLGWGVSESPGSQAAGCQLPVAAHRGSLRLGSCPSGQRGFKPHVTAGLARPLSN